MRFVTVAIINIFVFYIGGMLLGLGLSWTAATMVGVIIAMQFIISTAHRYQKKAEENNI